MPFRQRWWTLLAAIAALFVASGTSPGVSGTSIVLSIVAYFALVALIFVVPPIAVAIFFLKVFYQSFIKNPFRGPPLIQERRERN